MKGDLHILHLEDNLTDAALVGHVLGAERLNCVITHVRSGAEYEQALGRAHFDVVLSDYALPGYDGFAALRALRARDALTPFIIVSGSLGEEQAIDSLKSGATDYVLKQRLTRLAPAIRRAVAEAKALQERKRAEKQIHEQAALLDKARDAICVTDMDQRILYWNKSAERLYGWTQAEALNKNACQLLFQDDLAVPMQALKMLLRSNEWQGELQQVTKTRNKLIVESRWTLVRDEAGVPKSMLVINTDITEKKQIEAQFLRTQRMETIGALAGGIAHDLNNMLSPILMAVDLLRESRSPPDSVILETVATSARRGAEMVQQILSFARGASGEHGVTDLQKIIKDMARLVKETFPRSLRLECSVPGNLWPVHGNPTQLHQVLLNLCVNARDAMKGPGVLAITAANVNLEGAISRWMHEPVFGPHVRLSVSDTGQGIAPEVMDKLFEPFFTTKPAGEGTGLGLTTVMGIVKHHGGFLDVVSRPGKGATFSVYLPVAETREAVVPVQRGLVPDGHGEEILVVDDEAALLEMTRLILETHNYRVQTATDGASALRVYDDNRDRIDLVITDMVMPGMDGATTIRELRRLNPRIKIVAMTGLCASALRDAIKGLNVIALLQKPYPTEELLKTIRGALSSAFAAA